MLTQKSSSGVPLKRAELAAMTEFIDNVNMLMGTIGYKLSEEASEEVDKDRTYFYCKAKSGDAKGYCTDDGFVVVKGSKVSPTAAADVVLQSYVSGTEYWVDANGMKLKEYNI